MNLINELQLFEEIGRGKSTYVKRAIDPIHGAVAVKVFERSPLYNESQWQSRREMIITEANLLAKVKHPNAVQVFYVCEKGTNVHLVMEIMSRGTLLKESELSPLTLGRVRRVIHDVASALEKIHDMNILHRDIKPDNIMLTNDGRAKIGDFGFATEKIVLGYATKQGYPRHHAPEVIQNGQTSIKSEVWALGMTAYRLINGELMYRSIGDESVRADKNFTKTLSWLPHIPKAWRRLICSMLEYAPEKRLRNMSEVLNSLACVPQRPDWTCSFDYQQIIWEREKGERLLKVVWDRSKPDAQFWRVTSRARDSNGKSTTIRNSFDSSKIEAEKTICEYFETEKLS